MLLTSEDPGQRYVYASLLCRAAVQTSGPFSDDVFYLVVEETEARTRLMCARVNLSAKPTFKKGKKKTRKKKSNQILDRF